MFIKLYAIALPIFLILDAIWLGFIAKNFYAKQIGFLFKSEINWAAALIFYLLFIVGLIIFVINPSIEKSSLMHAMIYGAAFGLISYATYDLTNLATIKDWPVLVTIVDLIWGSFLSSMVSVLTYVIFNKF